MKVLGIIPARAGSKRVPNKNIKLLNGKPLIQYTIDTAKNSDLLTDVVVSTDSKEYAEVIKKLGGRIPELRPGNIATDKTPDKPVIMHMLDWFKQNENKEFDAVVLLRPTTPFKTAQLIDDVIKKSIDLQNGATSIRTVTVVEGINHPYWMYQDNNGIASPLIKGKSAKEYYQSQMLPEVYRLNGVVDLIFTKTLLEFEDLYGDKINLHKIEENMSLDIDTQKDFDYCDFLLKKATN